MSWRTIAQYSSVGEAEGARLLLRGAGIDARLGDDHTVGISPHYAHMLDGVKLQVREEDVARADELLAIDAVIVDDVVDEAVEESVPAMIVPPEAPPVCPNCGSRDTARIPRLRMVAFMTLVVLGLGVAIGRSEMAFGFLFLFALALLLGPTHRCPACGEKWRPPEDELARQHHAPPPDGADLDA